MKLEELKKIRINKKMMHKLHCTHELGDDWNDSVYRSRMEDEKTRDWNIHDMTHIGNNPRTNKNMLDHARCYYEKKIYTDEEWEKYFLPAITKQLKYNNKFVRWFPGYLIRNKETGEKAIVEYDYDFAYNNLHSSDCTDYTDLCIYDLDEKGNIMYGWAWANYDNYELVDKKHTTENLIKIQKHKQKIE